MTSSRIRQHQQSAELFAGAAGGVGGGCRLGGTANSAGAGSAYGSAADSVSTNSLPSSFLYQRDNKHRHTQEQEYDEEEDARMLMSLSTTTTSSTPAPTRTIAHENQHQHHQSAPNLPCNDEDPRRAAANNIWHNQNDPAEKDRSFACSTEVSAFDSSTTSNSTTRIATTPAQNGIRKEHKCPITGFTSFSGIIPTKNDVLCGRGNSINSYSGNQTYRKIIQSLKLDYVAAPKPLKALFPTKVVAQIEDQTPPGRFLKFCSERREWHEISSKQTIAKTRQALREGAPSIVLETEHQREEENAPKKTPTNQDALHELNKVLKAFRNTDEIIAAAASSAKSPPPTMYEESPALQQTQRPVNTLSSSIRQTDVVSHHRRSNYFKQEQGGDIHDCSVNHKKRSAPPASLSPAAHRTTHDNCIPKKDFVDLNQNIKPPQVVCHFDNNTILSYHGSYKRPRLPNEEKYAVLVEIEDRTGSLQLHRDEPRSPDNKLQIIKSDHEMHVETKPAMTACGTLMPEQCSSQNIAAAALLDLSNRS